MTVIEHDGACTISHTLDIRKKCNQSSCLHVVLNISLLPEQH